MKLSTWIFCSLLLIIADGSLSKKAYKRDSFGLSLFHKMGSLEMQEKNWLISPASIKSVLEEVYLGTGGSTKKELASSLGVKDDNQVVTEQKELEAAPTDGVVWKMANRILLKSSFSLSATYESQVTSIFHAEINSTDFSNAEAITSSINSWVSSKTDGLIKELISPGDFHPSSLMIILNAVYFKGTWKFAFKEKSTEKNCFYSKPGKCNQIEMMKQRRQFKYGEHKSLDAKIIQLPYNDMRYSMVIVLPNKYDGLAQVVKQLPKSELLEFTRNMTIEYIRIIMPKFTTKFKSNMNEPLKKMGINEIFQDNGDFSAMTKSKGVYVSDVIHEAHISVTEEGTVAAASTGMVMTRTLDSIPPDFVMFNIDHPFLYFIIYNEDQVLFAGQYTN